MTDDASTPRHSQSPYSMSSHALPRPDNSDRPVPLSVLVPVYNEAATIEALIDTVRAAPFDKEIICVDDGSTDGTSTILERLLEQGHVDRVLRHASNRGKGAAIRTALGESRGEIVLVQDADLEYAPADWGVLLQPIFDGRADAVFGSRFLGGPHRVLFYWHFLGNRLLTTLSNIFTNLNLTDMETCSKAIRGDLARALPLVSNRFGFEPEITARLAQCRARIYEVPISYSGRTYAEGKKIRWFHGVAAIGQVIWFNIADRRAHRVKVPPRAEAAVPRAAPAPSVHAPPAPAAERSARTSAAETPTHTPAASSVQDSDRGGSP